jgi:cation transport ATPase
VGEAVDRLLAASRTLILLAVDGRAALVIGVTDPIKPFAKRAVAMVTNRANVVLRLIPDHRTTKMGP